ncbi:MAG: o-succinylbenzoate--CoA ligase [Cyanobacteria bacterium KgW148]|nr:o-succinylbenzoate--CoA ligase [Cyanobacteria bacterium KgW148]
MKVVDPLYLRAICDPDALFLVTPSRSWSYLEVETRVNGIISYCWTLGIKPQDKVGILAPNQPSYIFWILALTRMGAISVCLNVRLSTAEISKQLKTIGVNFLVTDRSIGIENITIINLWEDIATIPKALIPVLDLDRSHSIFFSSGTTAIPKAINLTLANHYYSAIGVLSHLSISISDRSWLLCLPLFHVGGFAIIWRCLWSGMSINLIDRFDVTLIIESIVKHSIGWASFVPTMVERILSHPLFLESLTHWQKMQGIMIGGAPMAEELQKRCLALQLPIVTTYGLTEASSTVTTLPTQAWQTKPRSSGRPIPGVELRIVAGQIQIKGRSLFTPDWFNTKDIGYLDDDGHLFVIDRLDNMIICGGENIYPQEIERVLLNHPSIKDVCVIGKKDKEWGQIPLAVIETQKPIELDEIKKFCLSFALPSYKVPKAFVIVDHIPKTASGKTDRASCLQLCFAQTHLNLQ